jgi:hypothetical protein
MKERAIKYADKKLGNIYKKLIHNLDWGVVSRVAQSV